LAPRGTTGRTKPFSSGQPPHLEKESAHPAQGPSTIVASRIKPEHHLSEPGGAELEGPTCSNGHVVEQGFSFCPTCGGAVPPSLCSNGHPVERVFSFCPTCGAPTGAGPNRDATEVPSAPTLPYVERHWSPRGRMTALILYPNDDLAESLPARRRAAGRRLPRRQPAAPAHATGRWPCSIAAGSRPPTSSPPWPLLLTYAWNRSAGTAAPLSGSRLAG
jgi:hypothetical protein